ncbi:uncharacterized protein LOC117117599, partial [Anneissia japonica]|uniref:uncharacterized protein LOC117117599 n=1 Tax=Anneissia japonica TaxID=1529436 RepID=UPI0014255185
MCRRSILQIGPAAKERRGDRFPENRSAEHRRAEAFAERLRRFDRFVDTHLDVYKLKKKNLSIEHLQFRLHRNKLDSSVDLKEHEVFVPGHDKERLNQLLRENVRLRTVLNSNYSSEEVAEAKKTIAALRIRIAELSFEVRTKDKELTEYLSATNSSDSEKDVAIRKLTSELKECYGQRNYADDVRRTLCREIELMRSKIDDLVTGKIDVAREPRNYERREKDVGEQRNVGSLSSEDRCKVLEEQVSSLARENAELSKQLKEVISMNTRWQRTRINAKRTSSSLREKSSRFLRGTKCWRGIAANCAWAW